ncbi:hypothetical protein M3Y95_01055800 [Aphelenchoides besseyi]|nr:hypothetical protein M3Y95_01055800 [Aphelenchoides besseyi]
MKLIDAVNRLFSLSLLILIFTRRFECLLESENMNNGLEIDDGSGDLNGVIPQPSNDFTTPQSESVRLMAKRRPPSWSKRLTDFLLSQHSKESAPDGLIDIEYELELVHILQIDELKQTLTCLVYVDQRWNDPSLSWDPSDFGDLNKTWLPVNSIWSADVMVVNLLHADDVLSNSPALIYSNGTVECTLPAVYTVSCEINIKHFPIDDQRCALEVASWSYNEEKLRLHPHLEHNLQHYVPNEEWHLINVTVSEAKYDHEGIVVSELYYEISVRRKPLFYFITVTIPSYVMCVITIIGLFARASTTSERIERFTLGVMATITSTSTAVLSLVVSEKVPHSSTAIPLLVAYFLFNMMVLSTAVIITSVILRVHRCGRYGNEPPDWAMRFCWLKIKKKKVQTLNIATDRKNDNGHQPSTRDQHHGPMPWTSDVLRVHRRLSAVTIDSPLQGKLYALEAVMNQLCQVWQGTQIGKHAIYEEMSNEKHRAEYNGYVRIAERMDWFFMILFLVLLTIPVIYLYIYL